jgi:hypothetical protein
MATNQRVSPIKSIKNRIFPADLSLISDWYSIIFVYYSHYMYVYIYIHNYTHTHTSYNLDLNMSWFIFAATCLRRSTDLGPRAYFRRIWALPAAVLQLGRSFTLGGHAGAKGVPAQAIWPVSRAERLLFPGQWTQWTR